MPLEVSGRLFLVRTVPEVIPYKDAMKRMLRCWARTKPVPCTELMLLEPSSGTDYLLRGYPIKSMGILGVQVLVQEHKRGLAKKTQEYIGSRDLQDRQAQNT